MFFCASFKLFCTLAGVFSISSTMLGSLDACSIQLLLNLCLYIGIVCKNPSQVTSNTATITVNRRHSTMAFPMVRIRLMVVVESEMSTRKHEKSGVL